MPVAATLRGPTQLNRDCFVIQSGFGFGRTVAVWCGMKKCFMVAALCAWTQLPAAGQVSSVVTAAVPVLVTVEARHGKDVPAMNKEDFMALQRRERLRIAGVVPQQGENAALELFVLVDDASDPEIALHYEDLRKFINAQPATTSVGIRYMSNTSVQVAQNPTNDHARAAAALRLPMGAGAMASPWLSLRDLFKRWPANGARREVIVATSGVDPLGGYDFTDPYLNSTIESAQRAGIVVYAIYAPAAGHAGHSPWLVNTARNHLAQLAEETGGESYMLGFGEPVSFQPYLTDIAGRLTHQYKVSVVMKPENKDSLQEIRFVTEVPNAELVAADRASVASKKH